MERLTKIDNTGRNVVEVKKFCKDDDWYISKMADGVTIRFHSKAIDILAELEDFMEEQGFDSLEDLKNAVIEKLTLIAVEITNLEQENKKLKQQLVEKEKEIKLLNAMINTLPEHDKELEEIHNEKKSRLQ